MNAPRIQSQFGLTLKGWAVALRSLEDSGVELGPFAVAQLVGCIREELGLTDGDMDAIERRLRELPRR